MSLALDPGYRESIESWLGVLRDLQDRGMNCPRLVVGDGNLGLWSALSQVFLEGGQSRLCRENHKLVNVGDGRPAGGGRIQHPPKVRW
jgi:transposase-like protein